MADNPTVDNGGLTDYVVATDDDGTAQVQWVKHKYGADVGGQRRAVAVR